VIIQLGVGFVSESVMLVINQLLLNIAATIHEVQRMTECIGDDDRRRLCAEADGGLGTCG